MVAPVAAAASINPWLAGGALALGPLLQAIFPKGFGGQSEFGGFDPEKYRDDIVLSDADIGAKRHGLMTSVKRGLVNPAIKDIKKAGAARRLPSGAVTSSIKGAVSAGGEVVAKAEPAFQEMKRKSMLDFINLKKGFVDDKAMVDMFNTQNTAGTNQIALGGLAKLLMLWESGALNKDSMPQLDR